MSDEAVAQMPAMARADLADRLRKKDAEHQARVAKLLHIAIGLLAVAVTGFVLSAWQFSFI